MSFSSMPDQDRPFRLRQTDSRFAPVTRHDATGSSRRRTTLSAKGDSRRSWSDNGFHGRYVSAGEVEPGFHVEPEPSVGLMLQSWEIGMTPPRTSNARQPTLEAAINPTEGSGYDMETGLDLSGGNVPTVGGIRAVAHGVQITLAATTSFIRQLPVAVPARVVPWAVATQRKPKLMRRHGIQAFLKNRTLDWIGWAMVQPTCCHRP